MAKKMDFGLTWKMGGNMARKIGKMARNSIFEPFSGQFSMFWAIFLIFQAIFQVRPNPFFGHFRPHFGDLYQVHGIPSLPIEIRANPDNENRKRNGCN